MKPAHTPWSPEEDARMIAARLAGDSCKKIGLDIGRLPSTVSERLTKRFGVRLHRKARRCAVELPTATIPLAELASHYALGWRVAWSEGGMVGLEWRQGGEVRWP